MKNPKFQIYTAEDGQFRFRLRASNGEIILVSEAYTSKGGGQKGIQSVKENALIDSRFKRKTGSDGKPYFLLVAANGEVIGQGESYSSEAARDKGIKSVQKTASDAPVEDLG